MKMTKIFDREKGKQQKKSANRPTGGTVTVCPGHIVRFWPRFGRLRQNWKILQDFYNTRLKSIVFDCWFDMFTDSRLMAIAIKFDLRRYSDSVRRFGEQSCSVTSPTTDIKLSSFFKTSYEQN